jgi:serine/threonine protein kinase
MVMTATPLLSPPSGADDDHLVATAEVIESLVTRELAEEFRVEGTLGWGHWGIRLLARDLHRSGDVILTALPPGAGESSVEGDRFLEALAATASLDHPHLLPVCGYGVGGTLRWYATPVPTGQTLAERIEAVGPLGLAEVRRIACQLASALDQAHRRGITHGALTASEVLLDDAGWVHVREIGIAPGVAHSSDATTAEQFERIAAPGQGSDQVALAHIIRTCLTGGADSEELPPALPPSVESALERATRARPTERFRDLLDFVAALDGAATVPRPIQPSQPRGRRVRRDEWAGLLETPAPKKWDLARLKSGRGVAALGVVAVLVGSIPFGLRSIVQDPPVEWVPSARAPAPTEVATPPVVPSRPISVPRPTPAATRAPTPTPVRTPAKSPARTPAKTPARTPAKTPARAVTPAPRQAPRETPKADIPTQAPVEAGPPAASLPGTLYISSRPWGDLFIDDAPIGTTPQSAVPLTPGRHHVRVTHDGFVPYDGWIDVPSAGTVRLTQIVLKELTL